MTVSYFAAADAYAQHQRQMAAGTCAPNADASRIDAIIGRMQLDVAQAEPHVLRSGCTQPARSRGREPATGAGSGTA